MTPAPTTARVRIDGFALLVAAFGAPGSSFLLWAVWIIATGGWGAAGPGEQLLGGLLFLVLIAAWGALPAAAFGAPALWLVHRLRPQPPLWALISVGMIAAALYAGCAGGLALAGQQWVFLAAPWTTGLLSPGERGFHPIGPMVLAIVLSGASGALIYHRVSRRRQA